MPKIGRGPGTRRWKAAAALIVLVLGAGRIHQAPAAAQPRLDEELSKQEKIYRSRGAEVPGGYVTYRTLKAYTDILPSGFGEALEKLGGNDRWLDVGAGEGQAILDYYAAPSRGKARVVAMSIEDRRTDEWRRYAATNDRVRYLFGKRLRDYSREDLGTFQVITDVYGGFSYTTDLSVFLQKTLGFLETSGSFYSLLASVRLENGKDDPKTTYYLTELLDAQGRDVKVCTWLKTLPCVEVMCESKVGDGWETPTELIRIRKVCGEVAIPPTRLLKFEAGQPPARRFQVRP